MSTQTIAQRRRARIVAIKASVRQIGMDDDTYRAMLVQVTGKASCAELGLGQLGDVLDHLRAKGAISPTHGRRRPVPAEDRAPLLAKIDALLADLGRVTGTPKTLRYVDAIVKKRGWGENVDFCDAARLRNVVGALNRTLQWELAKKVP